MNSLVGYTVYSDSESEEDGDDVNNDTVISGREVSYGATVVNKTRNLLLECGSASSESGSVSEVEGEDIEPSSPKHLPEIASEAMTSAPSHPTISTVYLSSRTTTTNIKLPPPPLHTHSDSSVFANPFKAQVDQKLNALQKHVPLTMQAKPSQIGGKRMCVAYRKDGRCRFGIKCKFAHDSDLQTSVIPSDFQSPVDNETPGSEQADPQTGRSPAGGSQTLSQESKQEETEGLKGKKRRVGVTNTLIPPKKAMKQYAMQRDRERLHMS
ncbi:uncharacterized protein si:ch211-113e8.11 [Lampris incognitus]|uniref:uncharacterized protein si:ch211-113e8.11 n=1 Tax=Lampris incognitus TaxID=2546036 RepID=UPI0024B56EFB|nr:uncharacterized protein si:ch211-113e8.11 [Lampris incognitus]